MYVVFIDLWPGTQRVERSRHHCPDDLDWGRQVWKQIRVLQNLNLCAARFQQYRQSFNETLSIDFQDYGPLIDPSIEKELQGT